MANAGFLDNNGNPSHPENWKTPEQGAATFALFGLPEDQQLTS